MENIDARGPIPFRTFDVPSEVIEICSWDVDQIIRRLEGTGYKTHWLLQRLHNTSRAPSAHYSETDKRGSGKGMLDKLKFTPPKEEEKTIPRYATYVSGNGMKIHPDLGAAKNSFSYRAWEVTRNSDGRRETLARESFILELVDGEWYVLFHVPAGTKSDELPWLRTYWYKTNDYSWSIDKVWSDERPTWGDGWKPRKAAKPMTREEYADWRVRVELERRGISP